MSITPSYFVSVGELSGDILAAEVVSALQSLEPDWEPFGIVGPNLKACGVTEINHIADLSVMGVAEVAKSLAKIRMIEQNVLAQIARKRPKFALLVDYPGFHFRLAEFLKLQGIPVFQYVAPKVWAWGSSRISKLRRDFTHVFGILPFEKDFFEREKVPYTFVGSPQRDRTSKIVLTKEDFGIARDRKVYAFLPGSRVSEVSRILPTMLDCARRIREKEPNSLILVPVAESLAMESIPEFEDRTKKEPSMKFNHWVFNNITFVRGMSLEVMKIADAALVASGTATLECGLLNTPMVVLYKMSDLTYWIAQRSVKLTYVSLLNLVAEKEIAPEYIQNISVHDIVSDLLELSSDTFRRRKMLQEFDVMRSRLLGGAGNRCATMLHRMITESRGAH